MSEMARDSSARTVLVLAALRDELQATVNALGLVRDGDQGIWRGEYGGKVVVAATVGPGIGKGVKWVERLMDDEGAGVVLIVGLAGGLDEKIEVGQEIRPGKVIDLHGESLDLDDGDGEMTLLTVDEVVASVEMKQALREKYDAQAVDMESFEIVKLAMQRGIGCRIIRVISDDAKTNLPGVCIQWVTREGERRPIKAAFDLMIRPRLIAGIIRIRGIMGRGSSQLAKKVCLCLESLPKHYK